jgi:hypothetical protein
MPAKLQDCCHKTDKCIESSLRVTMDLFHNLADYQTWICILCGIGVKPPHYLIHLTNWDANHSEVKTSKKARLLVVEELMLKSTTNPDLPEFQSSKTPATAQCATSLVIPRLLSYPHFVLELEKPRHPKLGSRNVMCRQHP